MIIKLPIPFVFARHKTEKVERPTTQRERVKADRLVMLILVSMAIATAIVFA